MRRSNCLLTDEYVVERNATGEASVVRHCTQAERGSFVLGSTVDPEATFRNHGKKSEPGDNTQVAVTDDLIREIFAATGATSDAIDIVALVTNQLAQTGHAPPKPIYDRAAGLPKLFHEIDQTSQGQTQLTGADASASGVAALTGREATSLHAHPCASDTAACRMSPVPPHDLCRS